MEFFLLLLLTTVWSTSAARQCNPDYEMPCLTSKDCIHKMQWCDRTKNCLDGSDERYCDANSCPPNLFACTNRKCIPRVAQCDGFDDCGDRSDEICRIPVNIQQYHLDVEPMPTVYPNNLDVEPMPTVYPNASAAVAKAADYLLRERRADNGWNSLTPRVAVALALVQRAGLIGREWLTALQKEVDIHVKINFMRGNAEPMLCDLAHYINALQATCQDPRNFQGIDLVRLLRSRVNDAKKLDLPFVLLTLCIAQDVQDDDIRSLEEIYFDVDDDKLGSKALIIMALKCISRQRVVSHTVTEKLNIRRVAYSHLGSLDVYTKALQIQALNALGHRTAVDITTHQYLGGSFGDVLATYYAIPVLLNTSLLDLKCESLISVDTPVALKSSSRDSKSGVEYSLWIEKDGYTDARSTTASLEGVKSFYDVMQGVAANNEFYRFLYEEANGGKEVYSIANIPNDPEKGRFWSLYRSTKDKVRLYSKNSLIKMKAGVDRIVPKAREHYVFSYGNK